MGKHRKSWLFGHPCDAGKEKKNKQWRQFVLLQEIPGCFAGKRAKHAAWCGHRRGGSGISGTPEFL